MAEQRLIDANALCDELKNKLKQLNSGDLSSQVLPFFIEAISDWPTIDPETLPIVQDLRKQVDSMNNRLSYIEFWERNLRDVFNSAAEDRAAVKTMRKHCEQAIFELRKELKHVTAERDAAIADMKRIAICKFCANGCVKKGRACFTCDNRECTCKSCFGRRNWEWRGLIAENTATESEVQTYDRP